MSTDDSVISRARELRRLHSDPELLVVVNVWDAITATTVANTPGTKALATASHGIAASRGYPDGEVIPRDEMIAEVGLIARQTELPVSADLEAGYGDPGETARRAIGIGAVGMNLEDQMAPLPDAVAAVEAVISAAEAEGVPDFVLNARTDAFLRADDRAREDVLDDALERGRAFLDAGAPVVFVVGGLTEDEISTLVEAFGPGRLSLIGGPRGVQPARMAELGVARVSFGPFSQSVALMALQDLATSVQNGGGLPEDFRSLS